MKQVTVPWLILVVLHKETADIGGLFGLLIVTSRWIGQRDRRYRRSLWTAHRHLTKDSPKGPPIWAVSLGCSPSLNDGQAKGTADIGGLFEARSRYADIDQ